MAAVDVSVEATNESQIQEVTLDGVEIYTQPLSMSENLTKLAHKIDFSQDEQECKGKPTSELDKEEEEEKTVTPFQPSLWPWDNVRNKLKAALTEMSVLLDVLNIAKEKRYMVLDPVSQESGDTKSAIHIVAKKRGFNLAGDILLKGCERLKKSQEQASRRTIPDFHGSLLRLRQNFRLKKVGNTILGDLSYKSAGSRYGQNGTFEVTKSDADPTDMTTSPGGHKSALQVTVPSELEGSAYLQVIIKRMADQTTLASAELDLSYSAWSKPPESNWQKKLEDAQTVIFCKEVFEQLAKEAVTVKSPIPHIVVGNQIFSHLFPGVQLSIALVQYTHKDKKCPVAPPNPEHSQVLEHSLHQLLKEVHHRNSFHPTPHPVTALLGMSKRRRLAGPQAFSRSELLELSHSETLLEQIIKQAKHIHVREKAIATIDELSRALPDPLIAAHWSPISSAVEAMFKINITSAGYETVRTSSTLHVFVDSLKAVCKDGRVVDMASEEQEIRDFLLSQVAQHHIQTVVSIAKMMGWSTLANNSHVGVGDMEPVGISQAITLASPAGDRVLCIRCGAASGVRVHVQRYPRSLEGVDPPGGVVKQAKWALLGGEFQEVHINKIEGKNFINRIELLMAALTREESSGAAGTGAGGTTPGSAATPGHPSPMNVS